MLSYYADLTHVSLDYLAGSVDKSYQNTALDNEIIQLCQNLDADQKEKLIQTLRIWLQEN
jgi:sugar diacid utilization regulator